MLVIMFLFLVLIFLINILKQTTGKEHQRVAITEVKIRSLVLDLMRDVKARIIGNYFKRNHGELC